MNFLFVVRNPSFFFQYMGVVEDLCLQGHKVTFMLADRVWASAGLDDQILEDYKKQNPSVFDYEIIGSNVSLTTRFLRKKREIINYLGYKKENPISKSSYMVERAKGCLPKAYRWSLGLPGMENILTGKIVQRLLGWTEKYLPAEPRYKNRLQALRPDMVIGSPYIFTGSTEIDFIRAANKRGIKTCASIYSWDNLTTKGLLQVFPDSILVWNDSQIRELSEIHSYPSEKVAVTGAPSLDFWFDQKPTLSRREFCERFGFEPGRKIVTYLCSSRTIAPNEREFIESFADYLESHFDQAGPMLLVRPHPQNEKIWSDAQPENYIVAPHKTSDLFKNKEARSIFYDTLHYSSCVVGMNTTAILEAMILGTPCISILSEEHKSTQEDAPHFRYLVDSKAVSITSSFAKTCQVISNIVDGGKSTRDQKIQKKEFVRSFIRPNGLEKSCSREMSNILIRQASGGKLKSMHIDSKNQSFLRP